MMVPNPLPWQTGKQTVIEIQNCLYTAMLAEQINGGCRELPDTQKNGYGEVLDKYGSDADFHFQQDLALAHSAKTTSYWFADHGFSVFDWPANSPELNRESIGYYQKEDERHQTQQCRWSEYQSNLGLH